MDNDQPNELDNQPKVSSDPSTRIPESTKGQINTICGNLAIERKRRVNHYQAMRGNSFALRSGNYSKLHPQTFYGLAFFLCRGAGN